MGINRSTSEVQVRGSRSSSGWSQVEEEAVIEAYRRMWIDQGRGVAVDIPHMISGLDGVDKEAGAIRMRMSNISAVLRDRGMRWVEGLSPLSKYAAQTKAMVHASLPWDLARP